METNHPTRTTYPAPNTVRVEHFDNGATMANIRSSWAELQAMDFEPMTRGQARRERFSRRAQYIPNSWEARCYRAARNAACVLAIWAFIALIVAVALAWPAPEADAAEWGDTVADRCAMAQTVELDGTTYAFLYEKNDNGALVVNVAGLPNNAWGALFAGYAQCLRLYGADVFDIVGPIYEDGSALTVQGSVCLPLMGCE